MKIGDLLIRMGVDDAQFRKGMAGAEKTAQSSGNFIANAFSTAIGMGMAQAGAAVSDAIIGIAKSFVTLNASMEQTRIAYTTLLGSSGAANAFINSMEQFAAVTPFAFEDVDKAAKRFLAFGIEADRVIPILTSVGDAAAALGLGGEGIDRITLALGQMSIKARLSGEEVRQLNEAGIGAQKYLTEAFGLTADAFDDLSKTGISGVQGMNAIIQGIANDKKFVGMMAAQATTALGIWSTAKDNMIIIAREMGEGLFNNVKAGLQTLTGYIEAVGNSIKTNGLAGALSAVFSVDTAATIYQIIKAFSALGQSAASFGATLIPYLTLAAEVIGGALLTAVRTLTGVFNNFGSAIRGIINVVIAYNAALGILAIANSGAAISAWLFNAAVMAEKIALWASTSAFGAATLATLAMNAAQIIAAAKTWVASAAVAAYNSVLFILRGGLTASAITTYAMAAAQAVMSAGSWLAAAAIAAYTFATSGASIATIAATAAQWFLNAALYACPLTWLVAAIVGVIAAIGAVVAAFVGWGKVIEWVNGLFGGISAGANNATAAIDTNAEAMNNATQAARENTRAQELQADGYDKVASSAIAAAEAQLESAKASLKASLTAGGNTGAIGSYIASVAALNNTIKGLGGGGKKTTASNVTSGGGGSYGGSDTSRASSSGVDSEKAAADEKARIRETLANKLIKLSMDEFDYQRYLLIQEVDECRKAGYDKTALAEYEKSEGKRITDDESDYNIKTAQDTINKIQEAKDAAHDKEVKALDVKRQEVELGGELNDVNKTNLDTQLKLMDVDKWQLEMIKQYPMLIDLINQVGAARKAIIEHVPEEQTLWQAFTDGIRQTTSEWGNAAQQWVDIGKTTATSMQSGFSDILFDGMQGDLKSFGDYFGSFCKSIMRAFTDMISKMLVEYITKSAIAKAFGGLLGGLSGAAGGGAAYTGQTGPVRADGSFAKGLDYVPRDNFVANLHKGEMVLTETDAEEYRSANLPTSLAKDIKQPDSGGDKETTSVIVNIYNQTDSKVETKTSTDSLGRTIMSFFISEYAKNTGNVQGLLKGAR